MAVITLLDGGMGEELVARAGADPGRLWATRVMIDHPELVEAVHADYFAAGASIATTNTYNILHDRLEPAGLDPYFRSLHLQALIAAHRARDAAGRGRIAGSIGPLGESYRPELTPDVAVSAPIYAEKARLLAPYVDLLLIETMPSLDLALGALKGAAGLGVPVWLSFTVMDEDGSRLRSGEPLGDVRRILDEVPADALLVNCSRPEAMLASMEALRPIGLPFGAYGNGFTSVHAEGDYHRHDLTPELYADIAMSWVEEGATIIGGCCAVGPDHIRHLAERLRAAGHRIE